MKRENNNCFTRRTRKVEIKAPKYNHSTSALSLVWYERFHLGNMGHDILLCFCPVDKYVAYTKTLETLAHRKRKKTLYEMYTSGVEALKDARFRRDKAITSALWHPRKRRASLRRCRSSTSSSRDRASAFPNQVILVVWPIKATALQAHNAFNNPAYAAKVVRRST